MFRRNSKRITSLVMAFALIACMMPVTAFAEENTQSEYEQSLENISETNVVEVEDEVAQEDSNVVGEQSISEEEESEATAISVNETEEAESSEGESETDEIDNDVETDNESETITFEELLDDLKILEQYANTYVQNNPDENATKLVINYIRTGVKRYNSDSWVTIAGEENTAFKEYVSAQDIENNTTASDLKGKNGDALGVGYVVIPNGESIDFGHLFGALNVSSNNSYNVNYTDFGSWLGDTTDLVQMASYVCADMLDSTDIDALVQIIREEAFGKASYEVYIDGESLDGVSGAFTYEDVSCDLDVYYIVSKISNGESISQVFESYFTESLNDCDRSAYFLNNRFSGKTTKDEIRNAIFSTYSAHVLANLLEEDRGIATYTNLKEAASYVVADYLYDLAEGKLITPEDPEEPDDGSDEEDQKVYSVFSSDTTTLAPGITQTINYALNADGEQIVYYYSTIDVTRDDVSVYANYNNNDPSQGWAMSSVSSQMKAAEERHSDPEDTEHYIENYSAIVGINASGYNMSTGAPSGILVMEGEKFNSTNGWPFFAILDDGTPIITSDYDTYADRIAEAVEGFSPILVENGELTTYAASATSGTAPRSAVGITSDGQVVFITLDGRQSPYSAGATYYELAQIMIDAGCVSAVALDGGGSSTFVSKQEGDDELSVVNRPSDGYERSVSSSLLAVSTAVYSTEFDHALITTDTDYLTVGSSLDVSVTGVSSSGNAAEIPDNAYLRVSDETVGSMSATTFTALARGTVNIELIVDDQVVGSKTLNVIRRPDTLSFTQDSINAIYGETTDLPLTATYSGNPVTINPEDISFSFSTASAGKMEGFSFVGDENSGIRKVTITATSATNALISAQIVVNLYSADESVFDFEDAMYGDSSFAWNREVSNAITLDDITYYIDDSSKENQANYTFAIDIQALEAPERLAPLMAYLNGFAGTSGNATPWDYLLALAARVNTNTNVTISVKIPEGVDINIDNLNVVNDYFALDSAEYDETSRTLSIICKWIEQDGAISPDTANSICILNGIALTPTTDAEVDSNNQLAMGLSGTVSYDIYLRSSQLYSLASQESNQEAYGIYPYVDTTDTDGAYGGHFSAEYVTFTDQFYIKQEQLNGWVSADDSLYYYADNEKVTGIYYAPGYDDNDHYYYYRFDESGICVSKMTGLFEFDGDYYYAINGEAVTGWRLITSASGEDQYYYFEPSSGKALDGNQTIDGYQYVFENSVLRYGEWIKDSTGIRYMWAGSFVHNKWFSVDGKYYYARPNTYLATGVHYNVNMDGTSNEIFMFSDEGEWISDYSGFYTYNGALYLMQEGVTVQHAGLIEIDGAYYYINSSNKVVNNCDYYVSNPNGLIAKGYYHFDVDGKMVVDEEEPEEEVKNGLYEEDGSLYYYVNGIKSHAGLVEIDGAYYYINSSCKAVRDCDYYVSNTNDLMSKGYYHFDVDGKMVIDEEEPEEEVKNGLYEEDGSLYYYVNGTKSHAGLVEINGAYYYINSSCKAVRDCDYYVSNPNGLMSKGYYHFDADGKMVIEEEPEEEVKNGLYEENGDLIYYVDGVKTHAGLVEIDGAYYYINSACKAVRNCTYYVSNTNNLMSKGYYLFDESGKMIVE